MRESDGTEAVGVYQGGVRVSLVCPGCAGDERIERYFRGGGELFMSLVLEAQSAVMHHDEFKSLERLRPSFAYLFERHIGFYRRVHAEFTEVDDAARLTEIAVWFGRLDAATPETVARSREFARTTHPLTPGDFGLSPGPAALQTYYRAATASGHAFRRDDFQALLCGSGGRVLLTVRDAHAQGSRKSRFGGAHITLIFDETAPHPRGGIQSLVGTKVECLALLRALRESNPVFVPDGKVMIT